MEIETIRPDTISKSQAQREEKEIAFISDISNQRIITGFRKEVIEILIRVEIFCLVIRYFPNPFNWYKIFKSLDPHRKNILGERRISKIVTVNGKYYWGLFIPGWPSKIFHEFLKAEINRMYPLSVKANRFTNIFMAVTNKCPLACEHCYAWDELNKGERLTLTDLKTILGRFQAMGVSQIHLSGGEPMVRMNDVVEVLQAGKEESEFWMLTSGFKLTYEKALLLKKYGMTGVMISLDHFDAAPHNNFRGYENAFFWVKEAVRNSIAAKLVTTLSICVTRSYVTEDNLNRYMMLAKDMGVSFVQILEPRATGHYKNQDVALTSEQEKILDAFYLEMNYNDVYRDFPPISYHGFHQRRMGCLAAGKRSLYVDTAGDIHACPFCQRKSGNALADNLDDVVRQLQVFGCHSFKEY